jgi:phosphatidylglycerol lysyltransferase
MKRRWILWLLVIAFVWVVVSRFTQAEKLAETLASGQWQWILAAAALQVIYYLVFTGLYRAAFYTVGVESRFRDLVPVTLGSLFVNVITPSGGAAGAALFVDDAAQRGQSPARAAAGTVLALAADLIAFALALFAGIAYLFARHDLRSFEVVAAILLTMLIASLSGSLLLGLWRPRLLGRLLGFVQRAVSGFYGWFRRPPPLASDWAARNTREFADAAEAIRLHPRRLALTMGIALAGHALDIVTLHVLFIAFGHPVAFGPLVAGYAMGILFWIISPTPQGIGVVEGVMALVYTSLGVRAETATVVSLAFRGLTFWLPLVLGFFLLRRVRSFRPQQSAIAGLWIVRLAAVLTAAMGVVDVISAVTPALSSRISLLAYFLPAGFRHGARLAAALAGFGLLVLAAGLWRRKQVAWFLTLLLLGISAVSHIAKGLDYEESVLALGLALWLWFLRPHFHALSDRPSVWQGIRALVGALLFTLAYGTCGFYFLDRNFHTQFSLYGALRQSAIMVTQFYNPGLQPVTALGRYFADSIYIVGAVTLGYALVMLLRPVIVRGAATPQERDRARSVVETHGRSSLARVALFDDKSYHFSSGGSVTAYVVRGRIAVALGDPIGPAEDAEAAIGEFKAHCDRRDWQAAFYQVLPDYVDRYRAAGFGVLRIGHEAIVDLATFTLEGSRGKAFRSAVNRLGKLGHRVELHEPPLSDDLLSELRAISDEWLTMVKGTEKRFSLGWFDDEYIRSCRVMAVHAPEGPVIAFANIIGEYQLNESTIDLMRHGRNVPNGTMDFLFVSLLQWAKAAGYDTFNFGLSPLAGVGEKAEDPAIEKAIRRVSAHLERFYSFRGLRLYKEKFGPAWSPRYLVYPGTVNLPATAYAVVLADSGGGFLPVHISRS